MEKFGCTVCHRGQGAAINFADAKAEDVHWDYPLLPAELTQASCGLCHVRARGRRTRRRGLRCRRSLFEEKGCRACHKLDGRGGQLGPRARQRGAEDQASVRRWPTCKGSQTYLELVRRALRDPAGIVAGSLMPHAAALRRAETTALDGLHAVAAPARSARLVPGARRHRRAVRAAASARPPDGGAALSAATAPPATIPACTAAGTSSSRRFVPGIRNAALSAPKTTSACVRRTSAKAVRARACRGGDRRPAA